MRFRLLTPRWIGLHLVALLAFAVCLAAGYWQFQRAQQPERGEIVNPAEELSGAQELDEVVEPTAYMPETLGNTAVTATGSFADTEPLLAPGYSEGADAEDPGELGYYVVSPLVTGDDTAVAVNRGWIPADEAEDPGFTERLPAPPEGEVTVTGWLQPPQKDDEGVVPMDLPERHIARIAPSLLVNEWPYRLYGGYLVVGEQEPADGAVPDGGIAMAPAPPPTPEPGIAWNWKNVSYAAQWTVFGGAVIVFWISLMRRELEDGADEHAAQGAPEGQASAAAP
ncbi:SURF1 family protein [Nocardiopsis baichengensis]|uniref:SURF1 family protein n=1 Tax=Nocardiopsis baichengensis TaxID=280240 RepID=UPI0005929D1C|nr:SURF1 family protein [Nocardiopsis baichengensis]